jgi:hypothetical protein
MEMNQECSVRRILFENSWCLAMMMMMKTVGVDLKDCDDFFFRNEHRNEMEMNFK